MNYKVLTLGPDYRTLKGGIASLLDVYAKNDLSFKFLPTYSYENNLVNILLFPYYYLRIFFFLFYNKRCRIVHIHGASQISFYRKYLVFISVKYILKRKVIYHIHGGAFHKFENESSSWVKKRIHEMLNNSDVIICLSDYWKNYFITNYKPKKVIVLNNIINNPKNIEKNKSTGLIQFLFLGKVMDEKGVFDLLNLVYNNKEYLQNKINIIVGGDGEIEKLRNKIQEFEISHIVDYIGWVSGDDKIMLLNESDVFLLPSYYEGLPISILEAMSYYMPIISTDVGGIPTIVKENINGILIKPGDQASLFGAMRFFIDNPDEIYRYGQNSYTLVKDYLPNKVINDLHKIYQKL